jgi:hypothetical protein
MDEQKVKEKGVKLTFGPCNDKHKSVVSGGGTNDYGPFTVKGEYDQSNNTLTCTKKYQNNDDSDDDADFEAAEAPEEGEAAALANEADMPIEQLMAMYGYGRGADGRWYRT